MTPMIVLAWRNVCRNRRRTAITAGIIGASLAALLGIWAFIAGSNAQAVESSTMYLTGHLQVAASGFFDQHASGRTIADPAAVARVLAASPSLRGFAPRLDGHALISAGAETLPIGVVGVDASREATVSRLSSAVTAGRYLNPDDTRAALLSETVARQLQIAPGASVSLWVSGANGALGLESFEVVGLFNTYNHDIDRAYCLIPLSAARRLYKLDGGVTTFVATTAPTTRLPETAGTLQAALGPAVEVRTWDALLPEVAQSVAFHEALSYMILAIVLVLVAIGVSNTMLVSVLERTPEWGALLALGARPAQLVTLVLLEGMLLGVLGLPFGLVAALIPIQYLSRHGINLAAMSEGLAALPAHAVTVYPSLSWTAVVLSGLVVLVVSLLAAVYPAIAAARLEPIEALRHLKRLEATPRGRGAFTGNRFLMLRLAVRNLLRNRGRSALVASASAVGVVAMLVMSALIDGFFQQIVDNSTRYYTADVQVGPAGFAARDPSLKFSIGDPAAVETQIRSVGVDHHAARRLAVPALVSTTQTSRTVLVLGVEPQREAQVTDLRNAVHAGGYLADDDATGILLGRRLADSLRVRLGEPVAVTGQSASGDRVTSSFAVRGLIETGSKAFDDTLALITLPAAQRLFVMQDRVSTIALRLGDRRQTTRVVAALQQTLTGQGFEAVSWSALLPETGQILEMAQAVFGIVLFMCFSIAAIGNMNTILMSVMERRWEIGTLLALGTSPGRVVRLVLYESLAVVCAGAALGILVAAAATWYFGWHGVDLSIYVRSFERIPGITSVLYPKLIVWHAALAVAGLLAVNTLTSMYPAWVAANLDPVENLRQ
jgi:putative ABC transport system permease protein